MIRASIVDLRYKMREVIAALNKHRSIEISYRGKLLARLIPIHKNEGLPVKDDPFFGMYDEDQSDVTSELNKLRVGRYKDI